jgi:hypothetical protein
MSGAQSAPLILLGHCADQKFRGLTATKLGRDIGQRGILHQLWRFIHFWHGDHLPAQSLAALEFRVKTDR